MSAREVNQPSEFTLDEQYLIKRGAPHPPKFSSKSYPELKCEKNALDVPSNVGYGRYSNVDQTTAQSKKAGDSLTWIISQLIEKEEQYVVKLKVLITQLGDVSTNSCHTLPIMREIVNYHSESLLTNFIKSTSPLSLLNSFIKHKRRLRLYVNFTRARKDFSYLVMDVCEVIIDHFKARLLEYNFTISQIKKIYFDDLQVQTGCDEVENMIKSIYKKINFALTETNVEEQK